MKKSIQLSVHVIVLFTALMLTSYIPELFPNFFGDELCNGSGGYWNGKGIQCDAPFRSHAAEIHWGYRHFLFSSMSASLFAIGVALFVNKASK